MHTSDSLRKLDKLLAKGRTLTLTSAHDKMEMLRDVAELAREDGEPEVTLWLVEAIRAKIKEAHDDIERERQRAAREAETLRMKLIERCEIGDKLPIEILARQYDRLSYRNRDRFIEVVVQVPTPPPEITEEVRLNMIASPAFFAQGMMHNYRNDRRVFEMQHDETWGTCWVRVDRRAYNIGSMLIRFED